MAKKKSFLRVKLLSQFNYYPGVVLLPTIKIMFFEFAGAFQNTRSSTFNKVCRISFKFVKVAVRGKGRIRSITGLS